MTTEPKPMPDLLPCPFCGEHGKPHFEAEKVFEHLRGKEMVFYTHGRVDK